MDLNKLEQETKLESDDCISENLMNNNVSNLIADDTNVIDQGARSNTIEITDSSCIKKTNFKNKKKQQFMVDNNFQSYLHDSKLNNPNYTNFATNPTNNNYSQTRTAHIQQNKALVRIFCF